jgi:hypothetical protein
MADELTVEPGRGSCVINVIRASRPKAKTPRLRAGDTMGLGRLCSPLLP